MSFFCRILIFSLTVIFIIGSSKIIMDYLITKSFSISIWKFIKFSKSMSDELFDAICWSLSLVVTLVIHCITRHFLLSIAVTHCHSLPFVATRCTTCCHSLPLAVIRYITSLSFYKQSVDARYYEIIFIYDPRDYVSRSTSLISDLTIGEVSLET